MHTEHVDNLLPDYLSRRLDESLGLWVERHLEHCGACQAELESLRGVFTELESLKPSPPPAGYFPTVLPRIRDRLRGGQPAPFFVHPLFTRFAAPLAVGVLVFVILFRLPSALQEADREHNPLKTVVRGLEADELVEVVLDQVHRQTILSEGESETSALLGVHLLRSDHLLVGTDQYPLSNESVLDVGPAEGLDKLSASEVDLLVARLGERTML